MTMLGFSRAVRERPQRVGKALLELAEDQWFERKSARVKGRDLAETLIAFANADGGAVVVGLSDGQIEGTDGDPRRRNEQMQAALDFCVPPVRARSRLVGCVTDSGEPDQLLVIEVDPPGDVVHATTKDVAFLRVGDENRKLSFAQRQELHFDRSAGTFEARPSDVSVDEASAELMAQYAEQARAREPEALLEARGLASEGELNYAGCLLFAREPQRALPEAYVRVLRYRGTERGAGARQQLTADVRIEGPIPVQLFEAREQIRGLQPTRRALQPSGRFGPQALVPEDAWLEALVNAAIHRSYSHAGDHIRVEIFDDRIEVSSPGRFPGIVGLSDPLEAPRFARNPRIARVCADLNWGQELGEGIRRIYEEMHLAGLADPFYRQTSGSVHVLLSAEPVDRELEERLPPDARQIVTLLRDSDRLGTADVASAIGLSRPAALARLRALREEGLIDWVGKSPKDPRAYWRLPGS